MTTTALSSLRKDLAFLCSLAEKNEDPAQLPSILKLATEKQSQITALLSTADKPPAQSFFSRLFSSAPARTTSEEAQTIQAEVSTHIAQILAKCEQANKTPLISTSSSSSPASHISPPLFSYPPPFPIASPSYPISSSSPVRSTPSPSISTPLAVGFSREGQNCWCNALLQMVVHVPSFRTAYEVFARIHQNDRIRPENAKQGAALLNALNTYDTCLAAKKPVPSTVSQSVRAAIHHFFPIIQASSLRQEDAYEAMQLIMGGYQDAAAANNLPLIPSLYTPIETKRLYAPLGSPRAADPDRLHITQVAPTHSRAYSMISADLSASSQNHEYQVFFDLQNKGHLLFAEHFRTYFRAQHTGSNSAVYLREDHQIQDFDLKSENRQFQSTPQELILTVKRFGYNPKTNSGFKITSPLAIPRSFVLPQEATASGAQPTYDLDAFIVHSGGYGGGHYIAYRKVNGNWLECNDSSVRSMSEMDIDRILGNASGTTYTSYIHHYCQRTGVAQAGPLVASSGITTPPPPIASPSVESLLTVTKTQSSNIDKAISQLKELNAMIKNPKASKTAISELLEALPSDLLKTIDHLIWIDKKTPNVPHFGSNERKKNPRVLNQIQTPWLSSKGSNLIEQLISVEETKKAAAEKKQTIFKLQQFIEQLNTPSVANAELKLAFQTLPRAIRNQLYGLIYQSGKIKYGSAVVNHRKYSGKYGEKALSEKGIREVLLGATEAVLNAHGKNIVEQLKSQKELELDKYKHLTDSQTLQCYLNLLARPASEISPKQLCSAFDKLPLSSELKEKFYMLIYIAKGMPDIPNCGQVEFKKDPRLLMTITDPMLIGPPHAEKGLSIIEQMIRLLAHTS